MSTAQSWKPASNPWLVAITVTLAVFMEILDTTIVNVALPHIAGSLSSSYDESTWVLTSYLVANGIVLPISAFFSRLFGRKQFFLICIVMFTICSFLCGIATELWQIILFRVLQGFWWRIAAGSAVCAAGLLQSGRSRQGIWALLYCHYCRAGDWSDIRWLDYRQLQLALGVLYQHSGRRAYRAGDLSAAGRSTVGA